MQKTPFILLFSLVSTVSAVEPVNFSREVLPVLSDFCFQCHGPDSKSRKADLRLDDEKDAKLDRDGLFVIKPGHPEKSELVYRLHSDDPDDQMPPPELGRNMSREQIQTIERWIREGAAWGKHWSFTPITQPEPAIAEQHPVDAFIDQRLKTGNLEPNPSASRETLIRRLALDLTGLPPRPEEVRAFVTDRSPDAWAHLIDRTLASPAYGERMAWDWLDAARYADSNGYQHDKERTMWPWRDWVIEAFNSNMPWDTFTIWQLAGDQLPNPTQEQILATGFNRNHMINGEGGRIPEENRVDYVMDMTETMGTVWLGLTLNCARCHDHKYDPVSQKEYYQLNAFFNQTPGNGGDRSPQAKPNLEVASREQQQRTNALQDQLKELNASIAQREKAMSESRSIWEAEQRNTQAASAWTPLTPSAAEARHQTMTILEDGRVLASGDNPGTDVYTLVFPLDGTPLRAIRLDALRHPDMTHGGLARSNSGNFVLTDIAFELEDGTPLPIAGAEASFEQSSLKITNTFDEDPASGWAVWNGKPIEQDHAALFKLKAPLETEEGTLLKVRLAFESRHKQHNLGHFRLSAASQPGAKLGKTLTPLLEALNKPAEQRSPEEEKHIQTAYLEQDDELGRLRKDKKSVEGQLNNLKKTLPKVMVMQDLEQLRKTYILDTGLYSERRDEVQADVPDVLPPLDPTSKPNRLALANWLVAPDHPLTARVTVNRFWDMLFGIGLVKTVEDFGVQAEYPTHPELLDWLAAEFIQSGWDVKHLLKTILTSQAYQRSSTISSAALLEHDPKNRLFARGARFRMPSWMIRDNALAASGLLVRQLGGQPVNGYQPDNVWEEATFGTTKYVRDNGEALYRRSIYTFWRRIVGPTMFFDSAKRQVCEVKKLRTNTPMHALFTYNDVTFAEAARSLAEKTMKAGDNEETRLKFAVYHVLAREPEAAEMALWKRALNRAREAYRQTPKQAEAFLNNGESPRDLDLPVVETAAYAAVCLNLLNLDETLTKE